MTPAENNELLPCPFCGCKDLRRSAPCNDAPDDDIQLNSWQVVCPQCLSAGPSRADEADMVSFWNTRTPPPAPEGGKDDEERARAYAFESVEEVKHLLTPDEYEEYIGREEYAYLAGLRAGREENHRQCVMIPQRLLEYLEEMREPIRTFFRDYIEQAERLKAGAKSEVLAEGWITPEGQSSMARNDFFMVHPDCPNREAACIPVQIIKSQSGKVRG